MDNDTGKKPTRTTYRPKVDIVALMVEMANTVQSTACSIGTRMAVGCLERLAKRACELNDPALLEELEVLGLVKDKAEGG